MKRNWETIRELLLAVEELEPGKTLGLRDFEVERAHEICYHVELLNEAGLVNATISQNLSLGPNNIILRSLSWNGHEFLDSIRSETTWEKTKSFFLKKGATMTFELIKNVAVDLTKTAMSL